MSYDLLYRGEHFHRVPLSLTLHKCDICGKFVKCDYWENRDLLNSVAVMGLDVCRSCSETWPDKYEVRA